MQLDVVFFAVVLLVFGCLAFVVCTVCVVFRAIFSLVQGLFCLVFGRCRKRMRVGGVRFAGLTRICPRPGCQKVEYRSAQFCSQCGHPLA